jgi:hypothetical protein
MTAAIFTVCYVIGLITGSVIRYMNRTGRVFPKF